MHQCIANRSFELSLLGSELEVIDVSYLPEIDDIEANVIRSVIAGGCMALFLLTTCGICQYRWTPERKFRSSGGSSDCMCLNTFENRMIDVDVAFLYSF